MNSNELKLPTTLSVDLAEETGIHIGDGCIGFHKSGLKTHWHYTYAFHAIDDLEYSKYVGKLIKNLYNLEPAERTQGRGSVLRYFRKDL